MKLDYKLKQKQEKIEKRMEELIYISDAPEIIIEAMEYSLLAGGKRIRPVLALSVCEALGGNENDILDLACAIEFIHTYSLIHDDLPAMDNDDLRRGKPTNHKVFGEAMAILAGDGLLNFAYEIIFNEIEKHDGDVRFIKAAKVISETAGIKGMIGGQAIDILNEGKTISEEILQEMHSKKTGALIKAPCVAGCLVSGNDEYMNDIIKYSENLGLAFQIIDDILDYTGDTDKLGKMTGKDKDNNKPTFVSIIGLKRSKELAEKYSKSAGDIVKGFDKTGFLMELTDFLLNRES